MAAGEIWVVDDNPAVAESIAALLMVGHHKVTAMRSTPEVLDALKTREPALMVLDIVMPLGGGNAVLDEVISQPHFTFPIIALVGDEHSIRRTLRGRLFRVLEKTVDPIELIATVKRALGQE